MPYAIDLFCGAGGMSEGIIQAGFDILFSNDINEQVQQTYMNRHNQLGLIQDYNTYFYKGDIRDITGDFIFKCIKNLEIFKNKEKDCPKEIDVVFGGPPCQGFSRAGKRKADDPRNFLFKEYVRVISQIRPKYVVMENVEGFLDTKLEGFIGLNGKLYDDNVSLAPDILREELISLEYNVLEPRVLNAFDFGVPQKRNRAIFIAYRNDCVEPKYPVPNENTKKVTLLDAIGDLIINKKLKNAINPNPTQFQIESKSGRTPNKQGETINSHDKLINNELSRHSKLIVERFSLFNEGEKGVDLRKRIKNSGIDLSKLPNLLSHCSKTLGLDNDIVIEMYKQTNLSDELLNNLLTKKNMRTRLDRTKPSLTVMTIADDYINPFENRTFTVRELARLQSFDDSFVFMGKRTTGGLRRRVEVPQYTQVGNAVPPLLAKAIASEIMVALKQ